MIVKPVTVVVANREKSQVDQAMHKVKWLCQGAEFDTDFKVFDIPHYDIIVGMEWLHTLGPMWVDWLKRTFRIKQNGKRITLRGVKNNVSECHIITEEDMRQLVQDNAVEQIICLCPVDVVSKETAIPAEVVQVLE